MPLDAEYQWSLLEKLSRSSKAGTPEGADGFYHEALFAWAVLTVFSHPKIHRQIGGGVIGRSIFFGQAHILILSIGCLWDKNTRFSYNKILKDKLLDNLSCADRQEREYIRDVRQHYSKHEGLKYCIELRHEVFAHNKKTVSDFDGEKVQEALRFLSRISYLIDSAITIASPPKPLQDFRFEVGKLGNVIDRDCMQIAEANWVLCQKSIETWRANSLLAKMKWV